MNVINNRFAILLAEKQIKERRTISLSEVENATGVSRQALHKWKSNTIFRFETRVIDALCQYFDIQPGELFEYVPNDEAPKKKKK